MIPTFKISEDDYIQACMQLPNQYIQEKTRLKNLNCHCRSADIQIHTFLVVTELHLLVGSEAQTHTGKKRGNSNDWHGTKTEEYQKLIQSAILEEEQKSATYNDFIAYVKPLPYGAITSNKIFKEHDRKFYYQYGCSNCHESGKIVCHKCDGAGSLTCNSCGGGGKHNCNTCSGSGRRMVNVPDGNGNNRTIHQHCHSCNGTGKDTCNSCGGRGKKRCSTCSGDGHISCSECEGTGYFTEVTEIGVVIHPAYKPDYEPNAPENLSQIVAYTGAENLGSLATIEFLDSEEHPDKRILLLGHRVKMPVATLDIEVMGISSQWTFFGTNPQIFDSGEIVEKLIKEDANKMFEQINDRPLWLPWNLFMAGNHLRKSLKATINKDILQHDIEQQDPTEISRQLQNAVSVDYIQKFLAAVRRFDHIQTGSFRGGYVLLTLLYFIGFSLFAFVLPESDPPFQPFVSFGQSGFYRAEISVMGSIGFGLVFYLLYVLHSFLHGGNTLRRWNKAKGRPYALKMTLFTVTLSAVLIFAVGISLVKSLL